jgi:hypothetical protein
MQNVRYDIVREIELSTNWYLSIFKNLSLLSLTSGLFMYSFGVCI